MPAKRQARTLRARPELVNNLLRDFGKIQRDARTLPARRRQVEIDKVEWEPGSIHDCGKTFGTRAADVVPMHVLQGTWATPRSRQPPGTTSPLTTSTPSDAAGVHERVSLTQELT